jgi:hypothetical protein
MKNVILLACIVLGSIIDASSQDKTPPPQKSAGGSKLTDLLSSSKKLNINPEGLALVGLMKDGSLMYQDAKGKKIELKSNGEIVALPANMNCLKPWKPCRDNGSYNPFPRGPYLLMGISDDGTVVNTAGDGSAVSIDLSTATLKVNRTGHVTLMK